MKVNWFSLKARCHSLLKTVILMPFHLQIIILLRWLKIVQSSGHRLFQRGGILGYRIICIVSSTTVDGEGLPTVHWDRHYL